MQWFLIGDLYLFVEIDKWYVKSLHTKREIHFWVYLAEPAWNM